MRESVEVTAAPPRTWLLDFGAGLALWAASVVALVVTEDKILLPTVVLLGSFLVPITTIF